MKVFFLLIILSVIIIYCYKYIIHRSQKAKYIKAGKKWESVIKELSKRK